jgi:hypothetical protein
MSLLNKHLIKIINEYIEYKNSYLVQIKIYDLFSHRLDHWYYYENYAISINTQIKSKGKFNYRGVRGLSPIR